LRKGSKTAVLAECMPGLLLTLPQAHVTKLHRGD
jgi:hypothetical protein